MTQDEIIRMAREAGFPFNKYELLQGDDNGEIDAHEMLERFAALVAAHEREKQAEQEPVAWNDLDEDELAHKLGWRIGDPLYMTIVGIGQEAIHHFKAQNTAPVQQIDLTDDEILPDGYGVVTTYDGLLEFARAVISAYKEKNK